MFYSIASDFSFNNFKNISSSNYKNSKIVGIALASFYLLYQAVSFFSGLYFLSKSENIKSLTIASLHNIITHHTLYFKNKKLCLKKQQEVSISLNSSLLDVILYRKGSLIISNPNFKKNGFDTNQFTFTYVHKGIKSAPITDDGVKNELRKIIFPTLQELSNNIVGSIEKMSVDDIAGNTAIYKIDPFPQELKPRILPGSADSLLCRTQTPDGRFWCIYSFKRINDNLLFRASQHILSNCTCREALDFMDDQSEIVFTAEESLKMQQIVTKKLAPYRPNQT